jgi:8-oxo-dGTP pyrophosphatase MutT (NUDIX family)
LSDILDLAGPNPWQTRSSRVIYDNGRLRLFEDSVIQPDGQPGTYSYIEVPWPVVAIVPIDDQGFVHLVRQWRYPWQQNSWEIPAGHGEPDETPLEGAQRELAEEIGMQAATWESLGIGFSSAALKANYHLYLARGLAVVTDTHDRDGAEDDLITGRVPIEEAVAAALDGRIQHGMSIVGLLRAARRLGLLFDPSAAQC